MGNGGIVNHLIYSPARALDFVFLSLRGAFRCKSMFLMEYLKIAVDTYLQLDVTCVISGVRSLWGLKKDELRVFLNANKHAKCYVLLTDDEVWDYHRSSYLW